MAGLPIDSYRWVWGALVGVVVGALAVGVLGTVPAAAQEGSKPAVVRGGPDDRLEWHLRDRLSGGPATTAFRYGAPGDLRSMALLCDWNGDGTRTPVVVRRPPTGEAHLTWYLRGSNTAGPADLAFRYGRWRDTFDQPVCGDWNGDGADTPGVVRQRYWSDGRLEWHLRNRNAGGHADVMFVYGRPQEMWWPVVGDWNGDGTDTPGVVYNGNRLEWHLRAVSRSGPADVSFRYGLGDPEGQDPHGVPEWDEPIVGDWTGDGRDTPGVTRDHDGRLRWLLKHSLRGGHADQSFVYGRSADPDAGRFDPDRPLAWR